MAASTSMSAQVLRTPPRAAIRHLAMSPNMETPSLRCPFHNVNMTIKKNRADNNLFWASPTYPQCRVTMPLEAAELRVPDSPMSASSVSMEPTQPIPTVAETSTREANLNLGGEYERLAAMQADVEQQRLQLQMATANAQQEYARAQADLQAQQVAAGQAQAEVQVQQQAAAQATAIIEARAQNQYAYQRQLEAQHMMMQTAVAVAAQPAHQVPESMQPLYSTCRNSDHAQPAQCSNAGEPRTWWSNGVRAGSLTNVEELQSAVAGYERRTPSHPRDQEWDRAKILVIPRISFKSS